MIAATPLKTLAAFALLFSVNAEDKPQLSKAVAGLRESLAKNQAQLRQYSWTETVEISLKGEVKKRSQSDCRYGPDGKVQNTPVGGPEEPKKAPKGLKGKVVANKLEELKEYMDRVGSLVRRYVPPDPLALKAAFEGGKASIAGGGAGGFTNLEVHDYVKPGDRVTFVVDLKTSKLRSFRVATFLDTQADAVSLDAGFSSLPDGVSFMEQSVLKAAAKELEIKTTNFGHHR